MAIPTVEITQPNVGLVDSQEKLNELMTLVAKAQETFSAFTQEAVDKLFDHCAAVANQNRLTLAKMAIDEAGMGILEDKTIKNHFAAEAVHNAYRNTKTCGIISRDEAGGYATYAEPVGVLAGIVPCTNPTSTTVFKSLLALKTRNCIVFSPHPRTAKCTIAAAKLMRDAAIEMGAPENCIGWIDIASVALCNSLMHHPAVALIVATGAGGLVKAAYSSGKPCLGGGPGNTPVIIDETADVKMAVSNVLLSKTFDNGMICASEQAVIAVQSVADKVREQFEKRGGYFIAEEEKKQVGDLILGDNGALNPAAVGQPAWKLAELAGLKKAPQGCSVLLANLNSVGNHEKLSHEKLCPCLGFFVEKDYDAALERALELVQYGGMGHTSVLYTDLNGEMKKERVAKFEKTMPTGRTLVCMPTSQGAIGDIFNFRQAPSLSLGCGSWGGNASSEGLQVKHLLNYKQIAERREAMLAFQIPPSVTFGTSIVGDALQSLKAINIKRALIVTSPQIREKGEVVKVMTSLESLGIDREVFSEVSDEATDDLVAAGVKKMNQFYPDALIALGGAPQMETAKLMRLCYENPKVSLQSLSTRFMSVAKRVVKFPGQGDKIKKLVCIPTTSGSGSEMTSFATITSNAKKTRFLVADGSLTPDAAIIDYEMAQEMSKVSATCSGFAALTNALDSHVSMLASDFTQALSTKAASILIRDLPSSIKGNASARASCHRASALSGMAASNAFVGVTHALAHQLTEQFGIPDGLAKAMVICQVIEFNAEEAPSKIGTFSQYERPKAQEQYAELSYQCKLSQTTDSNEVAVKKLVAAVASLKQELGVPQSLKAYGVSESAFSQAVDMMAMRAFDDQRTGTNPRYPLVHELKILLNDSYHGVSRPLSLEVVSKCQS